jgi:hypothetical protein
MSASGGASMLRVEVGDLVFLGRLEVERAPRTVAAVLARLPLSGHLLQARWSGESAWMPLGDFDFGVGEENATQSPAPGQLLVYPKGISETEILFPYGQTAFASKFGPLAGNHFLTIVDGRDQLVEMGRRVVWQGAQPIRITAG